MIFNPICEHHKVVGDCTICNPNPKLLTSFSTEEKETITKLYEKAKENMRGWKPYWTSASDGVKEEGSTKLADEFFDNHLEKLILGGNKVINDEVNSPSHYAVIDDIEAIDIIRELLGTEHFIAYCYGNVIKYALRAKKKEAFMKDIGKIKKYCSFILDEEE